MVLFFDKNEEISTKYLLMEFTTKPITLAMRIRLWITITKAGSLAYFEASFNKDLSSGGVNSSSFASVTLQYCQARVFYRNLKKDGKVRLCIFACWVCNS